MVPWCLMESCKSLWRWWNDEPRRGRPDLRAVGMIVNLTFESRKIQSSLHACAYKCPNVVVNSGFFFSVGKLHLCEWLFIISVRVKSQRGCHCLFLFLLQETLSSFRDFIRGTTVRPDQTLTDTAVYRDLKYNPSKGYSLIYSTNPKPPSNGQVGCFQLLFL